MALSRKTLSGGALVDVMLACMVPPSAQKKFRGAVKPAPKKLSSTWEAALGWKPPTELAEWAGVIPGYAKSFEDISDVWMLEADPTWTENAARLQKKSGSWNDADLLGTLMTGLELFGRDPSGDSAFLGTLPNGNTVSVHVFNHENGELEGPHFGSMAAFFARYFSTDEDDGGGAHAKALREFERETKQRWKAREAFDDPVQLWNRARWLFESLGGKLPYAFAEKLSQAPSFAVYEKEKKLLSGRPWLACYWPLAHALLGNELAYAEAMALAKKAPGTLTQGFLAAVEKAHAGKGLGKLPASSLQELIDAVRKNCDPSHLEAGARRSVEAVRSAGVQTLSPAAEKQRLEAGESAWALMRAFPDDVAAHDRLLKALARKDKALAPIVEKYFSQRSAEAYDEWPSEYDDLELPKELSVPVGAAFRAGLKFDSDSPKSNQGITQTLLHFDDDEAVKGWTEAVEKLAADDDRLQYVLSNLRASKHRSAPGLLVAAANRFFDLWDKAQQRRKSRDDEGPTLNNMFEVDSHLLAAVQHVLRAGGQPAKEIAARVLAKKEGLRVLGTALGLAFRVAGEQRLKEHLNTAYAYLKAGHERLGDDHVADPTQFNLTEAAVALAALADDKKHAAAELRKFFVAKRESHEAAMDLRAAFLAGLLPLAPRDEALLAFTERVLGNRAGAMRTYGALRAVERAKLARAKDWVRPHVYRERPGFDDDSTGSSVIQGQARKTMELLGEKLPEWDDEDEYANEVKKSALPRALLQPHRYRPSSVFERIREEKLVHPDVLAVGGKFLEDEVRYSADDPDRSGSDVQGEARRALALQGAAAAPLFSRILDLPLLKESDRATYLLLLRVVTPEQDVRRWLAGASKQEVFRVLAQPEPRVMGHLELVAAHAASRYGEEAAKPIAAALKWRLDRAARDFAGWKGWNESEPMLYALPRVLASLSEKGRAEVSRQHKACPEADDVVKEALGFAVEKYAELPSLAHDWSAPLTLEARVNQNSDQRLTLTLSVAGTAVRWQSVFSGLIFEHVVENATLTNEGKLDAASKEAALALANQLADEALRLGHRPPAPDRKAKKKR